MSTFLDDVVSELGWEIPDCPYCGELMTCCSFHGTTDSTDKYVSAEADFICVRSDRSKVALHGPALQTITFKRFGTDWFSVSYEYPTYHRPFGG